MKLPWTKLATWAIVMAAAVAAGGQAAGSEAPASAHDPASGAGELAASADLAQRRCALKDQADRLWQAGKVAESLERRRQQLQVEQPAFGPNSDRVAQTMHNLAQLCAEQGDFAEARRYAEQFAAIWGSPGSRAAWRSQDGQRFVAFIARLESADAEQRWQLFDSQRQIDLLWEKREFEQALRFAIGKMNLLADLVGQSHPYWAAAAVQAVDLRIEAGETESVELQLRDILRRQEQMLGGDHPDVAETYVSLAELANALGKPEQADELYQQAIRILEQSELTFTYEYAKALNNLATTRYNLEQYAAAAPLFRRTLQVWASDVCRNDWQHQTIQENLAECLLDLSAQHFAEGDFEAAEQCLREAQQVNLRAQGPDHFRSVTIRVELDLLRQIAQLEPAQQALLDRAKELEGKMAEFEEAGRWAEAHQAASRRLRLVTQVLGADNMLSARALRDVARLDTWLDDTPSSLQRFEQLAATLARLVGQTHPDYADALSHLAHYAGPEDPRRVARCREALEIYRKTRGEDSWDYAWQLTSLGRMLAEMGEDQQAEDVLSQALKAWSMLHVADTSEYAEALFALGSAYAARNEHLRAEPLLQEAVQVLGNLDDRDESTYSTYLNELANVYYALDKFAQAEPLYRQALQCEQGATGAASDDSLVVLRNLAALLMDRGEFQEAKQLLDQASAACDAREVGDSLACRDVVLARAAWHRRQQQYAEAARLVEQGAEITASIAGTASVAYADLLVEAAELFQDQHQQQRALNALRTAWRSYGAQLANGDASLNDRRHLADSLSVLAEALAAANQFDLAAAACRANLQATESVYPPGDWRRIDSQLALAEMEQLGRLTDQQRRQLAAAEEKLAKFHELRAQQQLAEAATAGGEVLQIRRSILGDDHRLTAAMLASLGNVWKDLSRYEQAYSCYQGALDIRRRLVGENHPDFAESSRALGIAARQLGKYAEAEARLRSALDAQARLLGENHADYAATLHSLAILQLDLRDYSAALPIARRAADLHLRLYGEGSVDYANVLRTLAVVYDGLGESVRAGELHLQVHNIIKEAYGEDHPEYVESLYIGAVVASNYSATYDLAESLFQRVLEKRAKSPGVMHADYANALNGYANLCVFRGKYEQAAELYRQAVQVRQEVLGEFHFLTAQAHANLGRALYEMKDYAASEIQLQRAIEIDLRAVGRDAPALAFPLHRLALVQLQLGRVKEAMLSLQHSMMIDQQLLDNSAMLATETGLEEILDEGGDKFDLLVSLLADDKNNPAAVTTALNWTLKRKGFVLDALCRANAAQQLLAHEPDIARNLEQLRRLNQQLSDLALEEGDGDAQQGQAQRTELRSRIDSLKERLALQLRQHHPSLATATADEGSVRAALPDGGVLLEFVRTRQYDLSSNDWGAERYLAFVVPADRRQACRLIDLGSADRIDAAIGDLRESIEQAPRRMTLNSESDLERQYLEKSRDVFARVVAPYYDLLQRFETVVVAPDGEIHKLPFAALAIDSQRYFIERFQLAYVSSGRDLLRSPSEQGYGTLVLADPDFDADEQQRQATLSQLQAAPADTSLAMRSAPPDAVRSLHWRRLAGASGEADSVQRALHGGRYEPVRTYLGGAAMEEIFKSARSPAIVHIATHGFYLEHQSADQDAWGDLGPAGAATRLTRLRGADNPLLRSGIVLAGANRDSGRSQDGDALEDGWVTAQEIAAMDFRGANLVVLSACETGLGDIKFGQGVHGLRRAFLHAGAETLLTSLFKVPDEETRTLMEQFYRALEATGGKRLALTKAQRYIIASRRESFGAAHPFFWASFILVGNPE